MNDKVVAVTSQNFESEVLRSTQPVLLDFWAEWCAPCRALGPTIDALAEQFQGRVKVAKLDVDQSPDVAGQYGVQSIPTLLLFRGGNVIEQRVGLLSKDELARLLDASLQPVLR